ncbi:MAG: hypothetical protein LBI65_00770 [Candidatus Symbiothrix sp.]|jgi:hypothetical protein|nr:hypothetical protein [Candidatus Symbiothrix sp.]
MKRFAAHYIFLPLQDPYKLHSIELNGDRQITQISPLVKETAGTFFCNGVILAVNAGAFSSSEELLRAWENILCQHPGKQVPELFKYLPVKEIPEKSPVDLYHLDGISLLPSKFRTDNSRCRCRVQRLC